MFSGQFYFASHSSQWTLHFSLFLSLQTSVHTHAFPQSRWVGWRRAVLLLSPFLFSYNTISSTCHVLLGMFYFGLKPTNVFMEDDAVDRRCHQICLIQKTQSWVATPQVTTTHQAFIPSLFHSQPFLFPTPSGSPNGFLTPCDHGQLKTSRQSFCFRMANRPTRST